jgi:DNA helicase-2/ATP-dependent DNA helicase PcrA
VVLVIGADARTYTEAPLDARLLYVAVTRALHRLYVLWTGQPSPLLSPIRPAIPQSADAG